MRAHRPDQQLVTNLCANNFLIPNDYKVDLIDDDGSVGDDDDDDDDDETVKQTKSNSLL